MTCACGEPLCRRAEVAEGGALAGCTGAILSSIRKGLDAISWSIWHISGLGNAGYQWFGGHFAAMGYTLYRVAMSKRKRLIRVTQHTK